VGLFRKPNKLVFEDHEEVKKKAYHMICNAQGKILELSRSCSKLMKITP